jgi:hypothetical protein
MPELKDITDEVTRVTRDAAYVAVGLGVLGFQRAQVRRQQVLKNLAGPRAELEERLTGATDELLRKAKSLDERVEEVIGRIEATIGPFEQRLPEPALKVVTRAHEQAREARKQIRGRFLGQAA